VSVPVGNTLNGAEAVDAADVTAAALSVEATEDPVIRAVALVPEVAEAESPDTVDIPVAETLPLALAVVKDA
jgi:hypothetical protein